LFNRPIFTLGEARFPGLSIHPSNSVEELYVYITDKVHSRLH